MPLLRNINLLLSVPYCFIWWCRIEQCYPREGAQKKPRYSYKFTEEKNEEILYWDTLCLEYIHSVYTGTPSIHLLVYTLSCVSRMQVQDQGDSKTQTWLEWGGFNFFFFLKLEISFRKTYQAKDTARKEFVKKDCQMKLLWSTLPLY